MEKKLTAKQKAFVEEYLVDLNATQAAIRAGYSAKTAGSIGQRLLTKVEIQAELAVAMAAREERTEITQDAVLKDLLEIKERCMQRAPVLDMKGHQVRDEEGLGLWEFDAKDALRALELLGKHLGMFSDKLRLEGSLDVNVGLADLLEEVSGDEPEGSEGADD
ncbi:terminase small subunit [Aminirod propionatiphilus]|uniref:Terminase small subunit n=1 Tax=Aminirod propionatiphilus TaxID=3415223 RepID=A0ACD1DXW2_9BACT|nr:terminase small subunit [Synergistota bacterium]